MLNHRGKLKHFAISKKLSWKDRFSWSIDGDMVGGTVKDWYETRPFQFLAIVTEKKIPVASAVYHKFKLKCSSRN